MRSKKTVRSTGTTHGRTGENVASRNGEHEASHVLRPRCYDSRDYMQVENAGHYIQSSQVDDERFGGADSALLGLIAARRNV
jgi:hypothetical protein